jgi:hypothetical protein
MVGGEIQNNVIYLAYPIRWRNLPKVIELADIETDFVKIRRSIPHPSPPLRKGRGQKPHLSKEGCRVVSSKKIKMLKP